MKTTHVLVTQVHTYRSLSHPKNVLKLQVLSITGLCKPCFFSEMWFAPLLSPIFITACFLASQIIHLPSLLTGWNAGRRKGGRKERERGNGKGRTEMDSCAYSFKLANSLVQLDNWLQSPQHSGIKDLRSWSPPPLTPRLSWTEEAQQLKDHVLESGMSRSINENKSTANSKPQALHLQDAVILIRLRERIKQAMLLVCLT